MTERKDDKVVEYFDPSGNRSGSLGVVPRVLGSGKP